MTELYICRALTLSVVPYTNQVVSSRRWRIWPFPLLLFPALPLGPIIGWKLVYCFTQSVTVVIQVTIQKMVPGLILYLDNVNGLENLILNFVWNIINVPLTWNRRIMLHISPRIARGFPSTMSNPLIPTSFTLKRIVNSVLMHLIKCCVTFNMSAIFN